MVNHRERSTGMFRATGMANEGKAASQKPAAGIAALIAAAAAATVAGTLLVGASTARGDEVQFNNGDRLTGTIVSADGGKLKIKTKIAGDVTVDMKDVKTFSTDAPVVIKLKDGPVVHQ